MKTIFREWKDLVQAGEVEAEERASQYPEIQ